MHEAPGVTIVSPDVSLACSLDRSLARAIARGLLFTMRDESDAERSVKCTRGQSSLVCARGGEAKPLAIDPGFSLPELWGQTFDARNVYLGHSVCEQITRNFCAVDVSGTECVWSVQICVFQALLRMNENVNAFSYLTASLRMIL